MSTKKKKNNEHLNVYVCTFLRSHLDEWVKTSEMVIRYCIVKALSLSISCIILIIKKYFSKEI